jgi:hypothetical protein
VTPVTQSIAPKTGMNALLTAEESALILADRQPIQFAGLHSREPLLWVIHEDPSKRAEAAPVTGGADLHARIGIRSARPMVNIIIGGGYRHV